MEVILEPVHPLLNKSEQQQDEDREVEDNMVVKVEYQGKTYRVDFSRESEQYQLMPRHIKKMIALEDIRKSVGAETVEEDFKKLAKIDANRCNKIMQNAKRDTLIERLRMKLWKKNPVKYKDIMNKE